MKRQAAAPPFTLQAVNSFPFQVVFLDFIVEMRALDIQFFGGFGNIPIVFIQPEQDKFLFDIIFKVLEFFKRSYKSFGLPPLPEVLP